LAAGASTRTPRPELRERVLASVSALGHQRGTELQPRQNEVEQSGSGLPRGPRLQPRRDSFAWSDARAWLPAAALLVIAAGLGAYSLSLRSRLDSLESRLNDASRAAADARAALASARVEAAGVQRTMAVLAAPDMARIDLAGQAVAPAARARAF